jgi:hypothetical protein
MYLEDNFILCGSPKMCPSCQKVELKVECFVFTVESLVTLWVHSVPSSSTLSHIYLPNSRLLNPVIAERRIGGGGGGERGKVAVKEWRKGMGRSSRGRL